MNYIKIKELIDLYEVLSSSIYLSGKEEELQKNLLLKEDKIYKKSSLK